MNNDKIFGVNKLLYLGNDEDVKCKDTFNEIFRLKKRKCWKVKLYIRKLSHEFTLFSIVNTKRNKRQ